MFRDVTAPNSPEIYNYMKRYWATVSSADIYETTKQTHAK